MIFLGVCDCKKEMGTRGSGKTFVLDGFSMF